MTRKILWALLILISTSSGVSAQTATAAADGGSAVVTGGNVDGFAAHIVFDYNDGINQIDIARLTLWVDARATVPFTVAFNRDPCKTYQYDTVFGVTPAPQYTMSDLGNLPPLASGMLYPQSNCWNPPDEPSPPVPPVTPPQCVDKSFTFGGEPSIARFPDGFVDPWLPLWRGPYYLNIPKHRYHVYAWTYDCHSCKPGERAQSKEIGEFWLGENAVETGLIIGPTEDIPDDPSLPIVELDYKFTDLGEWDITQDITYFYVVHALRGPVDEPTHSFQPLVLYLNCA